MRFRRYLRNLAIGAAGVAVALVGLYVVRNPERDTLDDADRVGVPGSFVRLTDGVTHYELTGADSAPTVVLVHGFSVPYYIWDSTATALTAAKFRVLRYDMYGRGWSDRPGRRPYNAVFFDSQLRELLDSLRVKAPVHVVGLSMGGPATAWFADKHPAQVRSLTFVDPVVTPMRLQRLFAVPLVGAYLWQVHVVPGMADSQSDDFVDPSRFPDWADRYRTQMRFTGFGRALRSTRRHARDVDLDALYTRVGQSPLPALILWGTGDRTVPIALSDALRKKMPNAEFHAIDGAGHIPTLEKAQETNGILIDFLRRHSR